MPSSRPEQESKKAKGSPPWMQTYSDTVTLLLTFFVMMLTFSTVDKEHFQSFTRGILEGNRLGPFLENENKTNLSGDERRLLESRLEPEGSQKPTENQPHSLDELTKYYPSLDVSSLMELQKAHLISIPLEELFTGEGGLKTAGARILNDVVKLMGGAEYRVLVATTPGGPVRAGGDEDEAIVLSSSVVRHLRRHAAKNAEHIGITDQMDLGGGALKQNRCGILLMEL